MNIFKKKIQKIIIFNLLVMMALSFFCVNAAFASTMTDGQTELMPMNATPAVKTDFNSLMVLQEAATEQCQAGLPLTQTASVSGDNAVVDNAPAQVPAADEMACCRDHSHYPEAIGQDGSHHLPIACLDFGFSSTLNTESYNTVNFQKVSVNISPPGDIALDTIVIRE
jgi:hypothetical protein